MYLDRIHVLSDGRRVRLRLARPSDRDVLEGDEMELRRRLRMWTIVATAFDGVHDRLAGFGSVDGTLWAADEEVRELLTRALDEHARTWRSRVA